MATSKRKFTYKQRDARQVQKWANKQGGDFDSYIQEQFKTYNPKEGDHLIRILPPTWDDPDNFGLSIWVHYGVGPDDQAYLCNTKMGRGKCPICEEVNRLQKDGQEDEAKQIKASERVAAWIIDRDDDKTGPVIWPMPWTVARQINKLSIERSGEILPIDDPDEGFDIEFERNGAGLRTKYEGMRLDRRPSPISDDPDQQEDWVDYIVENPLPEVLQYYEYDYIRGVFEGSAPAKSEGDASSDDDEVEETSSRRRGTRSDRSRSSESSDDGGETDSRTRSSRRERGRGRDREEDGQDDPEPDEDEEDQRDEGDDEERSSRRSSRRRSRDRDEEESGEGESDEEDTGRRRRREPRDEEDGERSSSRRRRRSREEEDDEGDTRRSRRDTDEDSDPLPDDEEKEEARERAGRFNRRRRRE